MEVLGTVLGDLAAVVADNDLFNDFSFNGELAVFSSADVERRAGTLAVEGDFTVDVVVEVFTVKVDGFVAGALLCARVHKKYTQ